MALLKNVVIERNENDELVLRWQVGKPDTKILIYRGDSVDSIDRTEPIAQTTDSSVIFTDLDPLVRHYFEVVPEGEARGGRIVAERFLRFKGVRNFRDLGGYRTESNQTVRWGVLYRSGNLSHATDVDFDYLSSLKIKTVFDLRSTYESQAAPSKLPKTLGINVVELQMLNAKMMQLYETGQRMRTGELLDIDAEELIIEMFRSYVADFAPQCGKLLQMLSDPRNVPALWHCSMGKDRTGFISAIVLRTLGIPIQTVVNDYLLSNQDITDADQKAMESTLGSAIGRALLETRQGHLEATFEVINQEYGSIDEFISRGMGVEASIRNKIRSMFLVEQTW